ncbi:hypothetical protein D9758_013023 [Tetrapyrgos nigripes]|uniref:Uncharacterized protein n=1 Tax=Tetrapyrgos nigripes TaxID=182062 RepID=A0A8H5C9Z2_9AGAR|nr:hypothetical protein D9758_013023 [Tetrapyrgos nigripes]
MDIAALLDLDDLNRLVRLAFRNRDREDPLYAPFLHLYSCFKRLVRGKLLRPEEPHTISLCPQLKLLVHQLVEEQLQEEEESLGQVLYRTPDFISLILSDIDELPNEVEEFLQTVFELKALHFMIVDPEGSPSRHLTLAEWLGGKAAIKVAGTILGNNMTQLILQGLLALHQYGDEEVFVVYEGGFIAAELKFTRPPNFSFPDGLFQLPHSRTADKRTLPSLIATAIPPEYRPSCTVELSPMFKFDPDGYITGLSRPMQGILQREYTSIQHRIILRLVVLLHLPRPQTLRIPLQQKTKADNELYGVEDYIDIWYQDYHTTYRDEVRAKKAADSGSHPHPQIPATPLHKREYSEAFADPATPTDSSQGYRTERDTESDDDDYEPTKPSKRAKMHRRKGKKKL